MENIGRKFYYTEEIVTDSNTGEVISQKTVSCRNVPKEPNFVKLYIDTMKSFNGAHDIPTDVLLALSKHITYANGESQQQVYLPSPIKKQIADDVGISISMINKYIKKMVDAGVLFRSDCRGFFIVNPWLIAKGEWKNISKLRAEFDFVGNTWKYKSDTPYNGDDIVI